MTAAQMHRGFAVVMADQADLSLAELTIDVLRQLLALHMHVHRAVYCDHEGFFEGTRCPGSPIPVRQFVAERFGLRGHRLDRFIRGLNRSPLFENNGQKNNERRFRLADTTLLDELVAQYRAFVAENAAPQPAAFTPLDRAQACKILGVSPAALSAITGMRWWDDAEDADRQAELGDPGAIGHMPQVYLQDLAAERLAAQLFREAFGDAVMIRKVSERLQFLIRQSK